MAKRIRTIAGCVLLLVLPVVINSVFAGEYRTYHISELCNACGQCETVSDENIIMSGSTAVFKANYSTTHSTSDGELHEWYDKAADECPLSCITYN